MSTVSSSVCAVARASSSGAALAVEVRIGLQHLQVRAQAGDGRAQLVRRVGHELALGGHGPLEGIEHVVEAAGQARQLVAAGRVDAPAEVLRGGHVLGRALEAAQRLGRPAGDGPPEQRGGGDAACRDQQEDQAHAMQERVRLAHGAGDLDGPATGQRRDEQAHGVAADLGVCQHGAAPAGRDVADAVVDRRGDRAAQRHGQAVGGHEALVEVRASPGVRRRRKRPAERARTTKGHEARVGDQVAAAGRERIVTCPRSSRAIVT
jgi:hypothetical protein